MSLTYEIFLALVTIIMFLTIAAWLVGRSTPEQKTAIEAFEKWRKHEKWEWIEYAINQLPSFLKLKIGVKDYTQISNYRKAVDLYRQLKELGLIEELSIHGDNFFGKSQFKKCPINELPNLTQAGLLTGTWIGYLIISPLKTMVPYLTEEDFDDANDLKEIRKTKNAVKKLLEEIKKSGLPLPAEYEDVFKESTEKIYDELMVA